MTETKKRSPITRLLSAVTAFGSAVCMLPAMPNLTAEAAWEYGITICGTEVTTENRDDILGDGVFCYDVSKNTLIINGDVTCDGDIIQSRTVLTICAAEPSSLTSNNGTPIELTGNIDTVIKGAALKLYAPNSACIFCDGNLHFNHANVYAEGKRPIMGDLISSLDIRQSVVYAVANDRYGAVTDYGNISYDPFSTPSIPESYYIKNDSIYDAATNQEAKTVLFGEKMEYGITIADTPVTLLNSGDILGNGVFSYNAEKKILDIHSDYTYTGSGRLLTSTVSGLTINTDTYSVLTAENASCFRLEGDTTFTGAGKLQLNASSNGGCAVIMYNGADLTAENTKLAVTGGYGLTTGGAGGSVLTFSNSQFFADCQYAVSEFSDIVLESCTLEKPIDSIIESDCITDSRHNLAAKVEIQPYNYNLMLCGTQVSAENASDILGDGTAAYDPATKTLTLTGNHVNTILDEPCIYNRVNGLTIQVANDSALTSDLEVSGICSLGDMTITGKGKLTINTKGPAIFAAGSSLTIKDANLDFSGRVGITGGPTNEKLTVYNSIIHVAGREGAITDFGAGIDLPDCLIVSPEGAYVRNQEYDGDIVNANGTLVTEVTIIPEYYDLDIAGQQVTYQNAADILGNGVFSFDPMTSVLTINGNYTCNEDEYLIANRINGLTIHAASDSVLTSTMLSGIYSDGYDVTITGPGKLTIDTPYVAVYVKNSVLTITDANLDLRGNYGITGTYKDGSLVVVNSRIHAEGNNAAVSDFGDGIELQDCHIIVPEDGIIAGTRLGYRIMESDGVTEAKVVDIIPDGAPVITKQPENASGCIGDKVKFSVEAEGSGLIYQWQYYNTSTKKWENTGLTGNKTATLTVTVTAGRNNMKYHCIVKDASGEKLVSNAATLKVNPKIVTQPVDASGCIGDKVQFTVEAAGVGLIYQWQYYNTSTKKWENTGLTGNKTATLTVTVTAGRNNMKYHCIVKDANGTKLTSTPAKLIVNPKIVTQPVDASGCIGDKVQFTVEAAGVGLIYQWQYYNTSTKKWENTGLTGNQSPTLTVTVTSARNGMKYHCIVKDANGTKLTSTATTLNVLPKIVTQPQSVSAAAGSTAKFTVEATGIGLTYQWQYYNTSTKKWENTGLAGNKTAELSVTAISSRNGMKYHCIVKDSAGNKLTSTAATLTVK